MNELEAFFRSNNGRVIQQGDWPRQSTEWRCDSIPRNLPPLHLD